MFGSGKKRPASRRPAGQFDTLISSTTSVQGNISFSGGLHIDGRVEGNLIAEDNSDAVLRVSEVGEVTGDIIAPHVIVNGTVNGDLYSAEHLELAPKAAINGNVYYNLLEMAMGAEVNGSLVRQKEPPRKLLDHRVSSGEAAEPLEERKEPAVKE